MELPSLYPALVKKEIEKFCRDLDPLLPELYEPMKYMASMEGKKIRPVMLLLACKAFGGNLKDALPAALAIELFHNFTLMHDDIMDHALLRRNKPSVHVKWNANIAILSGDALMIKAFEYMSKTKPPYREAALNLFTQTALKVCEGQQLDMNFETRKNLPAEDYLRMIRLKTAALFSASLKLGAMLGKASAANVKKMGIFGENTGMLFQLQDDVLDVFGKQQKVGKQTGGDIVRNKKTFLLLKALELAKGSKRRELEALLQNNSLPDTEKVQKVKKLYEELDVLQYARRQMELYRKEARKAIRTLKSPEIKILAELTEQLMNREL
ncbi:MAG: polyprenyl synthetase family protein [Bacteroidia bacterium]|nr:polyprenyl synthetase family protein [Bacteroidia bacterium]